VSTAEARGRLRVWKRAAADRYAAYVRVSRGGDFRAAVSQLVLRSSPAGRARVFRRFRDQLRAVATFEGACLAGKCPVAIWSVLRPRERVTIGLDVPPHLQQECVVVEHLTLGAMPTMMGVAKGLWSIEVPDHALRRLLERAPGVDIDATLLAAHRAALRARLDDDEIAAAMVDPDMSFLLPAGPGVFVCGFRVGDDVNVGLMVYLFAHTWLHRDQLYDSQAPLLVEGGEGKRLGEGLLLPAPLRRLSRVGEQVEIQEWIPGASALASPMGKTAAAMAAR
jgi:hypothetical protein